MVAKLIGLCSLLALVPSLAFCQEFNQGPLGPYVRVNKSHAGHSVVGSTDRYEVTGLPKQAGYVYRVWALNGATHTGTVSWVGSAAPSRSAVAQSVPGTIVALGEESESWSFVTKTRMPTDSATLRLDMVADGMLVECLGRCYGYTADSVQHFDIADSNSVDWGECGLCRQAGHNTGYATVRFPVVPGVTYRVIARVLTADGCGGTCQDEAFGFSTRAPGSGDVTANILDQGWFTLLGSTAHAEPADACGGFVGYGTVAYWLSSNSNGSDNSTVQAGAGGALSSNMSNITFWWQAESTECVPLKGLFTLTDLYVLPVGFTLRESSGGVARDDVWQDSPSITSDARLMLDSLASIQKLLGGSTSSGGGSTGSTSGGTTTGGTTTGGWVLPSTSGTIDMPLGHNLATSLDSTNLVRSIHLSESVTGFHVTVPFELVPTSGGPIASLGGTLWETMNEWRLTIRELLKWVLSLWRTWAFFRRVFGR